MLRYALHLAIGLVYGIGSASGASYRTENFIVTASTLELAQELAESAERYRSELSQEWFAMELRAWEEPCPISVTMGDRLRARGETSYVFRRRRPVSWRMHLQGTPMAIRESILPHEVTHAVFATYFGCPLPRWAEEGACVFMEHDRDRQKLEELLPTQMRHGLTRRLEEIFTLQDYPSDILPLYAQGYSLVAFLISQKGKQQFVQFLGDGVRSRDWQGAARRHYDFHNLQELETAWLDWALADRN